ncbi:acetyl-CoA synthetase-like protein [Cristinia sonorae]|uniref:Acetyl-CoA synthetase-like protein n=1 Tax=Cristinia sonorae TaxID=1940300 RepID=A0A8K0UMG6_9AGAR|nr:acetyl-CoA synthetase-like protein [Cristinia sonorae]
MANATDIFNPNNYKVLPLQPVPVTQALNSKTFHRPPLDGSLSIPEIYDWHMENSPNHPLFVYADDDGTEEIILWPDAVRAAHRAGKIVRSRLPLDAPSHPVVAILCASDTITYFLTQIGIVRANCVVFPISVRNSPSAVAHLLSKTDAAHILVGSEAPYRQLAVDALKLMDETGAPVPETSTMLTFEEIMQEDGTFEALPRPKPGWDDPAVIMHSSGSTAFPKPIVWSHWRYLQLGTVPYFGEQDFTGLRLGLQAMPMYHGMGMMQICWAAASGVVFATFKPRVPAIPPTPEGLIQNFADTKTDFGFCVPVFVEMWSRNIDHVQRLKRMKGVIYGGGPLATKAGNYLTEQGVNIFILYGCSEVGIMSPMLPANPGMDWQYFRLPSSLQTHLVQGESGQTAELVILPGPYVVPSVLNTVVNGVGAYATSDLLEPHPSKPGFWRVFGRTDDQIMHNNGEKTNPGPLELILNQDPHIKASVIFGRGKFNAGVLVDPKPEYQFDPADTDKLAEFRNLIWPSVERMNLYAPQHSRLFKEMILVSSPLKPLTYTAKLTPRRHAIINEYQEEIESLYAAAAESARAADNITPPTDWTVENAFKFVRVIVRSVLKRSIGDDEDLFQKGCDSLQATWIRNSILHALRESAKVDPRGVEFSFVYQFPSISGLARFISGIVHGQDQEGVHDSGQSTDSIVAAMIQMAERYSLDFPKHTGEKPLPSKDVVLVTGTTGALGATLLAKLVQASEVGHIYALNRKSGDGKTVEARQIGRLMEWGLDPAVIASKKVTFVEAEMSEGRLGLSESLYEELRANVTHIIHNAYPVNFALSLSSFEPSVRAARNLIDLALSSPYSSPAKLLLTSSIGVTQFHPEAGPVYEAPVPPESALSNGYTQSKWVIEYLFQVAQEYTRLRPVAVRVGQIAGGSSGAWNKTEWFPALLKSSQYLGCLPTMDRLISWIPADSMASAILDMRNSPYPILHLTHPRPVSWNTIITPISRALSLPLVPYGDWFEALRASQARTELSTDEVELMQRNPALMLLDFYANAKAGKLSTSVGDEPNTSGEAMGLRTLDVSLAVEVALSLQESQLDELGEKDAEKWIEYWKGIGFLTS